MLARLLDDPDPFVVAAAAGSLAKAPSPAVAASALRAMRRLASGRARPAGDPEADALGALAELIDAGQRPAFLPVASLPLHRALRGPTPGPAPAVPREAAGPPPRRLRLRTTAGEMLIELHAGAPLTVAALGALAARGFYDGLAFHRVVPDFVVQGGDPRGDGDGGPGWALPDEHSPARFLRGTLGIATSGPETGGSQIFLCHSAQPHLDGRYTIAGRLASGDDVLDRIHVGDSILSAAAE